MSDKEIITEQEKQEWLDSVHFGSCCRDPIEADTVVTAEEKIGVCSKVVIKEATHKG